MPLYRLVIDDVDQDLMHRLCLFAHAHDRSPYGEALEILREKVASLPPSTCKPPEDIAADIRKLVAAWDGVDISIPPPEHYEGFE